jgi:hypothetical protein
VHNANAATAWLATVLTMGSCRRWREHLGNDAVIVNVFTSTGRTPIDA